MKETNFHKKEKETSFETAKSNNKLYSTTCKGKSEIASLVQMKRLFA